MQYESYMDKEILYIDMDGIVANFNKAINALLPDLDLDVGQGYEERSKKLDQGVIEKNPYIFEEFEPIEGAIEAVEKLKDKYDVYF